ncbi:N/A [soil metagenome]
MNKLLPLLINRAETARDRQAALARDAANAAQQTQATLVRLEDFRGESLERSPASLGRHADAQALGDYQRFVSRLDDAIAMQRQECQRREERSAAGQQRLIEEQRKLMAFETLLRRRAAAAGIKQGRRAQSDADEFAARAARNHQGRSP